MSDRSKRAILRDYAAAGLEPQYATRFEVMIRQAPMRSRRVPVWRVGVVEIEGSRPLDWEPAMLSERSRGLLRIAEVWEPLSSAQLARAEIEARKLARKLNAQRRPLPLGGAS